MRLQAFISTLVAHLQKSLRRLIKHLAAWVLQLQRLLLLLLAKPLVRLLSPFVLAIDHLHQSVQLGHYQARIHQWVCLLFHKLLAFRKGRNLFV